MSEDKLADLVVSASQNIGRQIDSAAGAIIRVLIIRMDEEGYADIRPAHFSIFARLTQSGNHLSELAARQA